MAPWLALGLLFGCAVAVARAGLLVARGVGEGLPVDAVRWRVAGVLQESLPGLLVLTLVGGVVAHFATEAPRSRLVTVPAAVAALVFSALLALEGSLWSAPADRLLVAELLGKSVAPWAPRVAGGLLLSLAAACWLLARRPPGRTLGGAGLALALAVAAALPSGHAIATKSGPPTSVVEVVRRDLLFGEAAWETIRNHPEGAPAPGVIVPSSGPTAESLGLPSLVMAPPSEVRFHIGEIEGPLELRLCAGVDHSVTVGEQTVGFRILHNGATAYEVEIPLGPDAEEDREDWRWAEPLQVSTGDEVTLETWVVGAHKGAVRRSGPLKIGFANLLLTESTRRPHRRPGRGTPNIVFIVQDTHRADRLSAERRGRSLTPNIDRLAARGLRFESAHSTASWTWPATASLLTGLLPEAHGVTSDKSCYLSESLVTLAEALQERGYSTAAFSTNPLIAEPKNFDQGFETFVADHRGFHKSNEILDDLLGWIDENAGSRMFLYVHLTDPHTPHFARDEDRRRFAGHIPKGFPIQEVQRKLTQFKPLLNRGKGRGRDGELKPWPFPEQTLEWIVDGYDACIASGDHYVGRVLDRLEHYGLEDETIVVFTSDHGEEWYDHGLLMHGNSLHRELIRVPLVIAGPGVPRGVVERPVSTRHIAPTLARAGGGNLSQADGAPNLLDPDSIAPGPIFFSTTQGWTGKRRQPLYGVRQERWLLHFAPEGINWTGYAVKGGWVKLYDLTTDPEEMIDVSGQHPELAAELRELVLENLARQTSRRPDVQLETGDDTLEMLYAIGYLGN